MSDDEQKPSLPPLSFPRPGPVLGIGADIIEVSRIERAVERHGERFYGRILTDAERDYCLGMKKPGPHLAARFAAKEAISKVFRTGIGSHFGWKTAEVTKGSRGEPLVKLDAQGEVLLRQANAKEVLLTLSHTEKYAMAVAILIGE